MMSVCECLQWFGGGVARRQVLSARLFSAGELVRYHLVLPSVMVHCIECNMLVLRVVYSGMLIGVRACHVPASVRKKAKTMARHGYNAQAPVTICGTLVATNSL